MLGGGPATRLGEGGDEWWALVIGMVVVAGHGGLEFRGTGPTISVSRFFFSRSLSSPMVPCTVVDLESILLFNHIGCRQAVSVILGPLSRNEGVAVLTRVGRKDNRRAQ